MRSTPIALTLPEGLPRWTVPVVMLATLALELYDIWTDIPDTEPVAIEFCATICAETRQRMTSWAPHACTCDEYTAPEINFV